MAQITCGDINSRVLLCLYDEDKLVGILAGICDHGHFLAKNVKVATELFWWVEPSHRGGPDSYALFDAFEEWAIAVNATHIVGAHFPNDKGKKVSKYYTDKGFIKTEEAYMKEIK